MMYLRLKRKKKGVGMKITLKAARVNADLTQDEVAKSIEKSVSTIQKWESGASFPDVANVKKLEKLYNIPYDNLIFLPKNNG